MNKTAQVPETEILKQREYMALVKAMEKRPRSFHIVSMGCQMNERDSETVAGMLCEMGMTPEPVRENADLILYNTCCIRENAENKALGNVIWLKELKKDKPELMICVGGCMTQEKHMADAMKKNYPFIDVIYGTHNLYRLPEYIHRVLERRRPVVEIMDIDGEVVEGLPEKRRSPYNAFVNIMYGCNNFCTYCIVPYVRGRERSRKPEDILEEALRLRDSGVKEIMLLGQNVNSYRGGGTEFAELLYRLDRLEIPRIRFMTSHPKDISDEVIAAFGELTHLMPHLHLPVQAGNDEILRRMNRHYDKARYLDIVRRLRATRPDIGLTTDIIVGFPGETLEQFEETLELVKNVRYDSAYTFIFSPRVGTAAAKMEDNTPYEVKSERLQRLIAVQQQNTADILAEQVGRRLTVLAESVSARDSGGIGGKTPRMHMVNFPGDEGLIGQFVDVEIISAGRNTLRGRLV